LRRLGEAGTDVGSFAELRGLAERGDPLVTAELDRAAGLIGRVLALVVGVLNPADLVVAGELAVPAMIAGIRAGIYTGAQPRATARLRARAGRRPDRAGARRGRRQVLGGGGRRAAGLTTFAAWRDRVILRLFTEL
jgi:predicted NBD/HSP70 family sugar kinase